MWKLTLFLAILNQHIFVGECGSFFILKLDPDAGLVLIYWELWKTPWVLLTWLCTDGVFWLFFHQKPGNRDDLLCLAYVPVNFFLNTGPGWVILSLERFSTNGGKGSMERRWCSIYWIIHDHICTYQVTLKRFTMSEWNQTLTFYARGSPTLRNVNVTWKSS